MCEFHSQSYSVYPHHRQKLKMIEDGWMLHVKKMIMWPEEEEYYNHVLSPKKKSKINLKPLRKEKNIGKD